jgi:Flp pilus assembly pilin Flp
MFDLIRTYIQMVLRKEEGQGLTEYALILSLILVGVGALLVTLNGDIQNGIQGAIDAF